MKKIIRILLIVMVFSTMATPSSHAADGDLFPYPVPPDDMLELQKRCDFLVSNFWKRCNFKTAFSSRNKLDDCFGDWVSVIPYASADTVHAATDRLLSNFKKSGPQTLIMARMAERHLYGDSADIFCEEIYLPFARAAAANKKIDKKDRAYFAAQAERISNSAIGAKAPALQITLRDGSSTTLAADSTAETLIIFIGPDTDAASMARARLSIDFNTNELIRKGRLRTYAVYAGEATDPAWQSVAESYPDNWIVGAAKDATRYFDLRRNPEFYFLDNQGKVVVKSAPLDNILAAFRTLNMQLD